MVTVLALVLVGLLAAFVFGGIILRTIGWLLILAGLIAGVTTGNLWALILPLAAGAMLWLAGQYHFAVRHHYYRSAVAATVLRRLPTRIEPTHNWTPLR